MFHKKRNFPIVSIILITSVIMVLIAVFGIAGLVYVVKPQIEKVVNDTKESADQSLIAMAKIIAGFEGERTYLVLLQNNHELRATGGFIGQYAVVRVKNGEVIDFFTQDAGMLDTQSPVGVPVPRAPQPLATYLNQNFMFFRDANWDPNFDTAAPHIAQTYALEAGRFANRIDGVVAIDTHVLVALFEFLDDIEIDGTTYSAHNIVDTLEYEVEVAYRERGVEKAQRKDIIGVLAGEMLTRAKKISPLKYPSIIKKMEQLADEKHLLAFDYDTGVQTWYRSHGWDGTEYYDDDHVVQVIDSNLNAFKTDRVISRSMSHRITQKGETLATKLTLEYTHNGKERDYRTREYRTYTRVRIPANATNITISGTSIFDEKGDQGFDVKSTSQYTEVGMFFTIDLNTTESVTISYDVSRPTSDEYTVEIVKQPGTDIPQLTLEYQFDTNIAQTSLENARMNGTQFVFNGDLRIDRAFSINF